MTDLAGPLGDYLARVARAVELIDPNQMANLAAAIDETVRTGHHVFVMGNGGSASTAAHYVNDLVMAYGRAGRSIRVSSLTDNVAVVTGISNDYAFDQVFEWQLRALGGPGDLAIAISASGNSPNLLRAVAFASEAGMTTAAVLGFDGGTLINAVDVPVHIPTGIGDYGPAEDAHLIINHAVASVLHALNKIES